ncbi:MAG: hypothetical protein IJW79_00390 [Clostridia bacterium]|nr:hypothetical protein [Clostridia bacterium]
MRLGSTPKHEFTLPFDVYFVKEFKVTYKQNNKIILEKYLSDFEANDNTLSVTLTQEETFLFIEGVNVEVQARVLTTEGDVLASNIRIITAERCLDREVLE